MSPLMKPRTSRKRRRLEGKEIAIRGIRAISWKVLTKVQRDSIEDWLRKESGDNDHQSGRRARSQIGKIESNLKKLTVPEGTETKGVRLTENQD